MTPSEFQQVMDRLDRLEAKIDFSNDPVRQMSVSERAIKLKAAIRSGDKKLIKEAKQMF